MHKRPVAGAVVGVLLAAGRGSRFDPAGAANKLLAVLPDGTQAGTPVAVQAARHLLQAVGDVVAVVPAAATHGAQVEQLAVLLAEAGCDVLRCPTAANGMGASLAAGVSARPDAGGWVIALADMPWIAPETIAQVAQALDAHHCVAPFHAGQRGHPIGFGADFFAGLTALDGDEGARRLIDPATLVRIDSNDTGILRDVDTPADLA
ncbi:nucleotidyltransferase family protein [Ralstonia insidiosa]|uniref:Molybdopterin-guanine dinucleotide biosynthesis protein MobA n=1 Tax=Ralstonia insidiosa TaxID=190721 RepID=A0A192A5E8_9RALS|nr:nucleotidyltransferase family protein [Ralstonia insidiosa]ANJ75517.1 molybdopterin-guanine dinucleotide biosynthesis protein MobA [Ralstonia insidiosa]KAB0469692.1 nucleotidyltransferase family protein [Ralstonia insidiosa]MBY4910398.1 nucleotidyltransferase family protein [Ralstonia insidiosa]